MLGGGRDYQMLEICVERVGGLCEDAMWRNAEWEEEA